MRQAFYAALGAEAAADAAHQGAARLRRHLADVEANLAVGMATEEARLQVLARLRRTEQATIAAEAEAATRRFELGRRVGQPGEADPAPRRADGVPADRLGGRAALGRAARATGGRRPSRRRGPRRARGRRRPLWPAVDLEGGWHYGKPGVDAVTDRWMDYGTVAVNLRWTLFDFGGVRSRVKGLRAESRALSAVRDDVQDALRTRQANARTQLAAARTLTAQVQDRLDLQRRRLDLAGERWREGHATESELLDAQDDVTLAATDLATVRAQLRLAEAELLAALGW